MEQKRFKVYKYFHVKKSYKEMLAENDYNPQIRGFILRINAELGRQRVVRELETIFEAAYWICGSLSHDFRKNDDYEDVVNLLPDFKNRLMSDLPQHPEAMDTLHAIVYLMLEHDESFQRPADADEAFSRIGDWPSGTESRASKTKSKKLAVDLRKFSGKDKKKYRYDYSISIDRNWKDEEFEVFIDGYYWEPGPDIAAEKILAFASYFDKGFDRGRIVDKAFSAVCNLYEKRDEQSYLGYKPQEYKDKLRKSLHFLTESRYISERNKKENRIHEVNPLFDDEELQISRASQFKDFLKKHKRSSGIVNCEKDNYINRTFVAFWHKWEWKDGKKPLPNGSACFRFLTGYCELKGGVKMKAYGTFIKKRIRDEKGVDLEVDDFLLNTSK